MPEPTIPPASACALYLPGHSVHFVQAKRSWETTAREELPRGEIISIEGEVVVVACEGGMRRYRNHDTSRLKILVDQLGPHVRIDARFGLLKVEGFCICIKVDDGAPLEPCVDPSTVPEPTSIAQFIEQTLEFGGSNFPINRAYRTITARPRMVPACSLA